MTISEMSDRELDRRVAEEVMGWELVDQDEDPLFWLALDGRGRTVCLPRFSTDISAAFQVVERMMGRGWQFGLQDTLGSGNEKWEAMFGTGPYDYEALSATIPRAICEAALMAVRSGKEDES